MKQPSICAMAIGAALMLFAGAGGADAQLLGRGLSGMLPVAPARALLNGARDSADQTLNDITPQGLLDLRVDRLQALVRAHKATLESDNHGAPVVRGVVLAISPSDAALTAAKAAGFTVIDRSAIEETGLTLVTLHTPPGLSAREGLRRLQTVDPAGVYDFDHLYETAGRAEPTAPTDVGERRGASHSSTRIGLVDTGLDTTHPALSGAQIEQQAFAPGGVVKRPHGTAVASLMVGHDHLFRAPAPGAYLYAADVYGSGETGGAGDMLVRAISWLAARHVRVINVSLVGPPNVVMGAVVRAIQEKGVIFVAAVGNDGPAAPPAFPASYPGVVAVTGVDGSGRILIESGKALHLDFAAPGADMAAAWSDGRYAAVRGTSFAAPIVAGQLAVFMAETDPDSQSAIERLARFAVHNRNYGRGLVGGEFRTPPATVHAISPLAR